MYTCEGDCGGLRDLVGAAGGGGPRGLRPRQVRRFGARVLRKRPLSVRTSTHTHYIYICIYIYILFFSHYIYMYMYIFIYIA